MSAATTAGIDLDWLSQKIDYRLYQDCVHCGLCTASCPTYVETSDENDSPRGRIYLMRAVTDGRLAVTREVRHHLNLCLDCRACESACPSGVQYGKIIEPFKVALQNAAPPAEQTSLLQRLILHHLFPYPGRVKAALAPARLFQKLGLLGLAEKVGLNRLMPPTLRRLQAMLPDLTRAGSALPKSCRRSARSGRRGRALPGLRRRRDVPRDQRRDRARTPTKRLRSGGPAFSSLLRRDPLSFGRRSARAGPRAPEPRGLQSRRL